MRFPAGSRFNQGFLVRRDQRDMIHAERLSELEQADDRRIAAAPFEVAQILLSEARPFGENLLCQALFVPDPLHISPDQPPHIHAVRLDPYILRGLSTIICICRFFAAPTSFPRDYPLQYAAERRAVLRILRS